MQELMRGLSFVSYDYDGGPLRFTVTFPYIYRSHVRAFVGDPDSARLVPIEWINENTVEIPNQDGILAAPYVVTLRRTTPIDKPVIEFRNGGNLPARDLNKALLQLLYAQQEARDADRGGSLPGGGDPGGQPDINEIIDQIMRSPALQLLLTRIELIDMNAEAVLEDILRSHVFFDTKRDYGDKISTAESKIELIENEGEVIARQYTELFARVTQGETNVAARFLEVNEAIATETEARTSSLRELHAQFIEDGENIASALNQRIDTVVANAESALSQAEVRIGATFDDNIAQMAGTLTAHVDGVEARVTDTETKVVQFDDNIAGLLQETETLATASGANTTFRLAMASKFGEDTAAAIDQLFTTEADERGALAQQVNTLTVNTAATFFGSAPPPPPHKVGSHWIKTGQTGAYLAHVWDGTKWLKNDLDITSPTGALLQNINETKIDAKQSQAIAATQLQAFKDGAFAAIRQDFDVVAGEHADMYGQWRASWSIRINAGTLNGQPVVSGVALSHNPATGSDFIVQADRFAIVHPQYTAGGSMAALKFPFVVGTVGGMATVGIQGQLVVDGSITANKITTNTLSAITANMGTVNGGTFKTHTLDQNGNVVDPMEFRAEITNVGTWPIWVGTGVKNENNAVFWVDRFGNAGFNGRVTAQNIMGTFQRITAVSWTGDHPTHVWAALTTFTVEAPVLVGETHIPTVMLSASVSHRSSDNGRCYVEIQQQVGQAWATVDSYHIIQGIGFQVNHALNYVGAPTTKAETFRVIVRDSSRGDRMAITRVAGMALGVR